MRNHLIITVAVLAVSVAAPAARAGAEAEIQKSLQADYNQRDSAYSHRDIDGTLAHYAPDFVGVGAGGKMHDLKEERADFLKTFTLPAKTSVTQSTIQKMTLGKAGTEATVTLHRHGVLLLVNAQTQLNEVLVLDGVFQDVWTKRPTGWVLTREQASSVKATMNGKPL